MFGDKDDFTGPGNLPSFFEPPFTSTEHNKKLFQPKTQIEKVDWTPEFSEKFDVIGDSINLALHVLEMSRAEYNASNISSLKSQRRLDCSCEHIWALNILIHYKKNTVERLPDLSPIKHSNGFINNYESNNNHQFENDMYNIEPRNKLYSSEDFSIYGK